MHIAYVLNEPTMFGGANKAFLKMLKELLVLGITPYVVVPNNNGICDVLKQLGVQTLVLNYRPSIYSHHRTFKETILFFPRMVAKIIVNYRAVCKLTDYIRINHIDLVHTNVGIVDIGFKAAQRAKIPHVYHIREYVDLLVQYYPCRKSFVKQLDQAKSYSICITKDIQSHFHLEGRATSRVIYDGVLSSILPLPRHDSQDFFLYVGRIEYIKGVDILLQAYLSYVRHTKEPLRLLVAGEIMKTPYATQQLNFITANGLSGLVEMLGERSDVGELMTNAKAIVIPSRHEGFGLCMPEAMSQGCLVIANNTGGSKEQLDNGLALEGQEIALRYDTSDELTQLLQEVSSKPKQDYMSYIERAYRTVNQLYTAKKNATEICAFYKDMMAHR